jgi:hypothetical protein
VGGRQKAEKRRQKAEDRSQKTKDKGKNRGPRTRAKQAAEKPGGTVILSMVSRKRLSVMSEKERLTRLLCGEEPQAMKNLVFP